LIIALGPGSEIHVPDRGFVTAYQVEGETYDEAAARITRVEIRKELVKRGYYMDISGVKDENIEYDTHAGKPQEKRGDEEGAAPVKEVQTEPVDSKYSYAKQVDKVYDDTKTKMQKVRRRRGATEYREYTEDY